MNFRKSICLTLVIALQILLSCTVHKRFTLHHQQQPADIPTNGFYFQESERWELPLVFFLYQDGTVLTGGDFRERRKGSNDPKEIVSEFWYERSMEIKGKMEQYEITIPWTAESGLYKINNDSITIQYFWLQTQKFVRGNVIELKGTVKNDSIIHITHKRTYGARRDNSSKLKHAGNLAFDPPVILKFYQYNDHRPDSSDVWFKKKKWYKRNE